MNRCQGESLRTEPKFDEFLHPGVTATTNTLGLAPDNGAESRPAQSQSPYPRGRLGILSPMTTLTADTEDGRNQDADPDTTHSDPPQTPEGPWASILETGFTFAERTTPPTKKSKFPRWIAGVLIATTFFSLGRCSHGDDGDSTDGALSTQTANQLYNCKLPDSGDTNPFTTAANNQGIYPPDATAQQIRSMAAEAASRIFTDNSSNVTQHPGSQASKLDAHSDRITLQFTSPNGETTAVDIPVVQYSDPETDETTTTPIITKNAAVCQDPFTGKDIPNQVTGTLVARAGMTKELRHEQDQLSTP